MRGRLATIAAMVAAMTILGVASAGAHGMRSAYVEVTELAPGSAIVHLRLGAPDPVLALVAPDGCALTALVAGGDLAARFDRAWQLVCPGALAGRVIGMRGLGPLTSDAVASIALADGTTATQLVRASAPQIELVTAARSPVAVAREFVGLGLVHLVTGYDHLLFLLLLVLLLGDVRSVLLAETAFTISHSLAFSATALGVVHVSAWAVEVCIALSLVLLAADVVPGTVAVARRARWRGAALALAFGFVHGLGFAGGLREIGLPEHAIGAALVGFGAGIELGQVAFLAVVLAAVHAARRVRAWPRVELAAVYAIGGFAAYLVLARAVT